MSVSKENLLRALEDYFMGRGRFNRSEYYGMRGSQISELLADYCEELVPDEQVELTHLLTEVAVGDLRRLIGHLHLAIDALSVFCAKGYLHESSESAALLEREFTDPSNVEIWTHAGEMTEPTGGADFKRTWHYAAALSFILMLLGLDRAASTRQYLLEHANSQDFRETLKAQGQSILFR